MKTFQTIGRYRVDALIGTGAMGQVYRAYDPLIDRPVAIKMVKPELLSGSGADQWLERFRREARAAGRRFHPHIVAILDIGEDQSVPFLAMEYVEGRTLDGILKTEAPLELGRSVSIITQVLSALGFAHQNGIVHRDIKPANIMVLANGDIKVADFGIARIDDSEFTIVGDVLGTPAYMAPEQLAGATADARTDLFAAAVILFEMLSGVKPFRGASITEIIARMESRPEDIGIFNPIVPEALKQVMTKALAFDPTRRYASAAEFSQAIATALPAKGTEIRPPPPIAEPTVREPPSAEPAAQEPALSAKPPESTGQGQPDAPPAERSRRAEQTGRGEQTGPGSAALPAELVPEIERDLATFIGPMAAIAVRRAVRNVADISGLYDALSGHIDDERDRARFLATGRRRASSLPTYTLAAAAPADPTGRRSAAAVPEPTVISAIEARLTRYIGPIAKILVRRELEKFETMEKLQVMLAAHISDERDRQSFLAGQETGGLARRDRNRRR
jgi:serine/threonine protein kinase